MKAQEIFGGFRRRSARGVPAVTGAFACALLSGCVIQAPVAQDARTISSTPDGGPAIEIEDVYLFYRLYDAAGGRPTADQLQRNYIDAGSAGLRIFAEQRNTNGTRIAEAIATRPEIYVQARRCVDALPRVRQRLVAALQELGRLYPAARFPPVTVAIGRSKPVAIGSSVTGVQIGLEALCATHYLNPNIEDRFVHVIAHEFIHVQQPPPAAEGERVTVLEQSLREGAAEFGAELISGDVAYSHLRTAVAGREAEIETAFIADQDKIDLSDWLNNGTVERPGDLGYWVGYRIAKAYYQHAADKRRALRDILRFKDAKALVAASGWRPGIKLR